MCKKGNNHKTRHHIICVSRGGCDAKDNIAIVSDNLHRKFHALFSNKLPVEILDFLVEHFWRGNVDYIYDYLERRRNA